MDGEGNADALEERIDVILKRLVRGKETDAEQRLCDAHEAERKDDREDEVKHKKNEIGAALLSHLDPRDQAHNTENEQEEERVEIQA